jgi:thiamine transport system ATP-binding protein
MPKLKFQNLKYSTAAWSGQYNLEFASERCYVLCGPSGAGKSTLVNLAAGFLIPQQGDILIDDKSICALPPHKRSISFMSQSDSLFPSITIAENLNLAFHDSAISRKAAGDRINEVITSLDIDRSLLDRLPSQLSGGQLSRCNLARAVLRPCKWLILDEPFAAVDRPTRLQILGWLQSWMKQTMSGIILISHDLDDIFTIATDITVIDQGSVIEHAPLQHALTKPSSARSARLLRSGLVTDVNGSLMFIAAAHLFTSLPQAKTISESFLASHKFKAPQKTAIGGLLRIIDLEDANDVTLQNSADFDDVVWFDKRLAIHVNE